MCDSECPVCPGTLCVHTALGNYLAVEMGKFLQEPRVLQHHRATLPRSLHILVVRHRAAVVCCELLGGCRIHGFHRPLGHPSLQLCKLGILLLFHNGEF